MKYSHKEIDQGIDFIKKGNYEHAISVLLPFAQLGHSEAQYYLAIAYYEIRNGEDPESLHNVQKWLEFSANSGNPKAQLKLGLLNLDLGQSDEANSAFEKAITSFMEMADKNNQEALYWLSQIFFHGWGKDKDLITAKKWLDLAITGEDPDILFDCAMAMEYLRSYGIKYDIADVKKILLEAAKKGSFLAQFETGSRFYTGEHGFPVDKKEAAYWFKLACEKKDARALHSLSNMLLTGDGIDRNLKEGRKLLILAAKSDDINAMYDLMDCYEKGLFGFRKSKKEALYWKEKYEGVTV